MCSCAYERLIYIIGSLYYYSEGLLCIDDLCLVRVVCVWGGGGGGWGGGGCFFFQAEDGIRDLVRSRGLGDVYKRQPRDCAQPMDRAAHA